MIHAALAIALIAPLHQRVHVDIKPGTKLKYTCTSLTSFEMGGKSGQELSGHTCILEVAGIEDGWMRASQTFGKPVDEAIADMKVRTVPGEGLTVGFLLSPRGQTKDYKILAFGVSPKQDVEAFVKRLVDESRTSGHMQISFPDAVLEKGTKWTIEEATSGFALGEGEAPIIKLKTEFVVKGFKEFRGRMEANIEAKKTGEYDVESGGIKAHVKLDETRDYWVRMNDGVVRTFEKFQTQKITSDAVNVTTDLMETTTLEEAKP